MIQLIDEIMIAIAFQLPNNRSELSKSLSSHFFHNLHDWMEQNIIEFYFLVSLARSIAT